MTFQEKQLVNLYKLKSKKEGEVRMCNYMREKIEGYLDNEYRNLRTIEEEIKDLMSQMKCEEVF